MKAKISEVFKSIQGEGKYAGVPQVFVRFFGCHMHCVWCDTPDSIGDGKKEFRQYSATELLKEVRSLAKGCHSVSLTGGEPLLQADFIKTIIPALKKMGLKIYLETSGVLHQQLEKVAEDIDIIAMDLKLPSSTQCRAFWKEHEIFLKLTRSKDCFIKAVVSSQTTKSDVTKAAKIVASFDPQTLFILQPNYFDLGNGVVEKCRAFQMDCLKYLADVRILPQSHKFMKLK